jgi:hypothetical protein
MQHKYNFTTLARALWSGVCAVQHIKELHQQYGRSPEVENATRGESIGNTVVEIHGDSNSNRIKFIGNSSSICDFMA